jgi:hypothetical protein
VSRSLDVRLVSFGTLEVDGQRHDHDVVIDGGHVRKRRKKPSKPYRDEFGHTPLSVDEDLPWGGSHLIVGTGANGSLPVMQEVVQEAARRDVDLVVLPTARACSVIAELDRSDVFAVLHVTC